jgi:ketosteroid isomerase-like protein
MEEWEHYSWTLTNWSEVGDHVIVDTELRATGRTSGVDVHWPHCHVYTFRDGKVIRHALYPDRPSALTAVNPEPA